MAARRQRSRPSVAFLWEKNFRSPRGIEVVNLPSSLASHLWYYIRAIGHVKHPPSFRMEHHDKDGYLLHFMKRGKLWHEVRDRRSRHNRSAR
jgi:hypothetical protein